MTIGEQAVPGDAREAAIANMTSWMVQAGVSPEDAEKMAPILVNGQDKSETP